MAIKRCRDSEAADEEQTPTRSPGGKSLRSKKVQYEDRPLEEFNGEVPTPTKGKGQLLFRTPSQSREDSNIQPDSSINHNSDRSARRKSARKIIERTIAGDLSDEDVAEVDDDVAKQILDDEDQGEDGEQNGVDNEADAEPTTPNPPSTRGPGRPKGTRRKRTPTPPRDLPPHEQYFFHNRPSSNKTSSNSLFPFSLLSHADYHDAISTCVDPHASSISYLHSLHTRAFPRWAFELASSFSICLYGYGSKRKLVTSFADYIHSRYPSMSPPVTIIINGYHPTLTLRAILLTIASALPSQPLVPYPLPTALNPLLTTILAHLTTYPPPTPIYLLLNSLDAPPFRRAPTWSTLSSLAAHPHIHFFATADSPSFPLLWPLPTRDALNFLFHDATTFVPYDAPIPSAVGTAELGSVVDTVNTLLGRKGANVQDREGVRWVLKSLPENARGLYRVLIAELLAQEVEEEEKAGRQAIGNNEMLLGASGSEDEVVANTSALSRRRKTRPKRKAARSVDKDDGVAKGAIEVKALYAKAVEEFLCSSEIAFRTLLKEFIDHQMVISRRDGTGGEVLGVALRRVEMEGVLEDLLS